MSIFTRLLMAVSVVALVAGAVPAMAQSNLGTPSTTSTKPAKSSHKSSHSSHSKKSSHKTAPATTPGS